MDAHIASHMGVIWAYIYNVVRVATSILNLSST